MGGVAALAGVARSRFELEFVEADDGRRRAPLTACWRVAFEDALPVRSFPSYRGQRNFPGWWWSSTTGRHVGHESWLERDHAMLLDFDPDVVGFASQPFWLHWSGERGNARHAPDFFARRGDGTGVVLDVRADDRVKPEDAEAFAVMARACEVVGWSFQRVGTVAPVLAANVRWLSRYRHPRCGRREDVAGRLLEVFATPRRLLDGAVAVADTLVVLPVLYHLLWRRVLVADLVSAPLGSSSVVCCADRSPG